MWTSTQAVERGSHTDELAQLWNEMTEVRRSVPGCAVVTADQVWAALDEIPDPEIPVISLVDLGVDPRRRRSTATRVRVEFTPTFLGCPALEVMRRALEEKVAGLGGEPEVAVIQDDSWSTDRITAAGREKLRAAGFAPPAPRAAGADDARAAAVEGVPLPVLRLDGDAAREHLRPDAVPLDPLVRELPPAVRAVQDDLAASWPGVRACPKSCFRVLGAKQASAPVSSVRL